MRARTTAVLVAIAVFVGWGLVRGQELGTLLAIVVAFGIGITFLYATGAGRVQ